MAKKTRVYELARELGKSSREVLDLLADSGVRDKNHMSALEDNVVRFIKNRFAEKDGKVSKATIDKSASQEAEESRPSERQSLGVLQECFQERNILLQALISRGCGVHCQVRGEERQAVQERVPAQAQIAQGGIRMAAEDLRLHHVVDQRLIPGIDKERDNGLLRLRQQYLHREHQVREDLKRMQ